MSSGLSNIACYEGFSHFATDFIDDILKTCSRALPCVPTSICIMRKTGNALSSRHKISPLFSDLSATAVTKRKPNCPAGCKVGIHSCKYFDPRGRCILMQDPLQWIRLALPSTLNGLKRSPSQCVYVSGYNCLPTSAHRAVSIEVLIHKGMITKQLLLTLSSAPKPGLMALNCLPEEFASRL